MEIIRVMLNFNLNNISETLRLPQRNSARTSIKKFLVPSTRDRVIRRVAQNSKLLFILLFLTTYSLSLAAQDTLGFTNKSEAKNQIVNGVKEGKWVEWFDKKNGIVTDTGMADFYSLTVYKADKPFGMVRRYTKPGKLVEEDPYSDAGLNGVKKEYFVSGKLRSETPYSKGKINGTKKIYFESGVLYREAQFDMGKPNGLEKYYYASGKLKSILKYIPTADGQFSILEKDYDEQGNEIKDN